MGNLITAKQERSLKWRLIRIAAGAIIAGIATVVLGWFTPAGQALVALGLGYATARSLTRFDPTQQPVAGPKQIRYAEIAFAASAALAAYLLPSAPIGGSTVVSLHYGLGGALTVSAVVLGGWHLATRHRKSQPESSWFGIVLGSWERLPKSQAALFLGGSIPLGGAINMYVPVVGTVLGVALVVVAGRHLWSSVRRRAKKVGRTGRSLVGVLTGPEYDALATIHRIPIISIEWDDNDEIKRMGVPLPARTAAKSEDDITTEVIARWEKENGLCTVLWDTGADRCLTIQRIKPLPESLRYDGRPATDETVVWLGIGKATQEHATSAGAKGTPKGATFDVYWDLRVEPHGISVGLTGQGKSQTIQLAMMQLALAGWGLVCIDPKKVEFTQWIGRPGILAVTTELEAHVDALESLVREQTLRYDALSEHGTNHIDRLPIHLRPRRVLVVIDEAVELLKKSTGGENAKATNELKGRAGDAIGSLMRLGRAAGIHVILGAQRADRAVLDGEFQNNLAFKILQGPAEQIERTMIGLNDVRATPGIPGRAVARTLKVPQTELQVAYLELDPDNSDLDRYLPVGGARPEPARPENPDITPVEASTPARPAAPEHDAVDDEKGAIDRATGQAVPSGDEATNSAKKDEFKFVATPPLPEGEAEQALQGMVGLGVTKERIVQLHADALVQMRGFELGLTNGEVKPGHYVYHGPPGTGKTTVARYFGSMLRDLGVLKKGHVIEVTPQRLKAQYVGHSGPKADAACDAALDGVLFIDEAYGLGRDEFALEALEQIMVRMENDRDRLCVILAGYPAEMDALVDKNPGLRSRIPPEGYIEFPAYTRSELVQIAEVMFAPRNKLLTDEAKYALVDLVAQVDLSAKGWGNARGVRNLVDSALGRQHRRLSQDAGLKTMGALDWMTVIAEDVLGASFQEASDEPPVRPEDRDTPDATGGLYEVPGVEPPATPETPEVTDLDKWFRDMGGEVA